MPVNINAANAVQASLQSADRGSTAKIFASMAPYSKNGHWVSASNVYRDNLISQLEADIKNSCVNEKDLSEYIAASTVLHMSDGWGFLGRAMQAHLLGDYAVARHLAYYAELRAAMSILACNGIGVFSGKHYVITGMYQVARVPNPGGTHDFTWKALHWWSSTQSSWDLVGEAFRPHGRPIKDWLSQAPKYNTWSSFASNWIASLGIDIQMIADDRESRNEASYRPTRINGASTINACEGVQFASELWRSLEPEASGFPVLDMQMLRLAIEKVFHAVEEKTPGELQKEFHQFVDDVTKFLPDGKKKDFVQDFLKRIESPDNSPIFDHALQPSLTTSATHHLDVMSRSALLLSLATSSCRLLVDNAGESLADRDYWWTALGADRGIWDTAPPSADLRDLWEDVQVALEDAEQWLDASPVNASRNSFLKENPSAITNLSWFELVGLWGMPA